MANTSFQHVVLLVLLLFHCSKAFLTAEKRMKKKSCKGSPILISLRVGRMAKNSPSLLPPQFEALSSFCFISPFSSSTITRINQSMESDFEDNDQMRISSMNENTRKNRVDFVRDAKWLERSKRWILLVDDEKSIRQAVGQLIFDNGYQVTACNDGKKALEIINKREKENKYPDVIVSDIRMPNMDGIELLKKIRSDPRLMSIPMILLTAKGEIEDRVYGYNSGADAYIPKPFDAEELVTVIDNLIENYNTLNGYHIDVDNIQNDINEIKYLLMEQGGGGIGNGWIQKTATSFNTNTNDKDTNYDYEDNHNDGNVFFAQDERTVLELLCQGSMNKEIASKTNLSKRRVEQLLTIMYRKTNVKNRTELVRWAIATGNVVI